MDTATIIAILRDEPEAEAFARALATTTTRMSAATYVEAGIVVDVAGGPALSRLFDDLLEETGVTIEPVTPEQARLAREAYRDYGRGSGHPAKLNYGDCFSYALARAHREPLLFKGDDFTRTDVVPAITAEP